MNNSIKLYAGGLAETVSHPSLLTFSFLQYYFTTSRSVGKAMELLQLPHQKLDIPLLTLQNNQTYVNLDNEEESLYKNTVFKYKDLKTPLDTPELYIEINKSFSVTNIKNTLIITKQQSLWTSNPDKTIKQISDILEAIPSIPISNTVDSVDKELENNLWPAIIALGLLAEFYAHLLKSYKLRPEQEQEITQNISYHVSHHDWILQSIKDLYKVKTLELSYEDYIKEYGCRADRDYEFSSPRWHEVPETMKDHVEKSIGFITSEEPTITIAKSIEKIVKANIQVQILRSQARKKILPYINEIRQFIIRKYGDKWNWNMLTRDIILFGQTSQSQEPFLPYQITKKEILRAGKGMPVSKGKVTGKALHIENSLQNVPVDTIAIFPNSSPEFTMQFPACKGIIFQMGGATSHGAIVSREYTIPALVDNNAKNIPNNTILWIDGETGDWKVLE